MNSLLKLEVFKGLGFETKESGMRFVKNTRKLSEKINEYVEEYEENKYNIVESIKCVFGKYSNEMEKFQSVEKMERKYRIEEKKKKSRDALKEQMRDEILNELKMERHSDMLPNFGDVDLMCLKKKFNDVLESKMSSKRKKSVMEASKMVESAIELLKNAEEVLDDI